MAYNRFRYYDPEDGRYISQDPIGLRSGEFGFYNYVGDTNGWIDVFGLAKSYGNNPKQLHSIIKKKHGDNLDGKAMREIQNTVDRIKSNRLRYSNDGTTFQNSHNVGNPNSQRLNTSNTYTEWTVKTPETKSNGARRIVVNDQTKQAYYSHDHYESFTEINLGGWK
ncbi:ribonuclease domain-containing protein [Mariniflexile ostreae]|uniref:Ribonuclease domain-containing protein n=1 Tax=Mariniflexile ostreae TaxID=1520892 RepID=A0ABV5FB42_9FLAO